MTRLVYYLFIKPISLLPLSVLHLISNLLFFIVYHIMGYRKKVVEENIANSFPEKSSRECKKIVKAFYRHFADLIVESMKNFSISKKEALERCVLENPEVLDSIYEEGRHAIIVGGHYSNWEMLAVALNPQVKHQTVGIYSPLSNTIFNAKFAESRSKFGLNLVAKDEVSNYFKENHPKPTATIFAADQSPTFIKDNTYWTTFLNQDTPMMFGTEKYATEYNYPVVFVSISKVKRGYYKMHLTLLEDNPQTSGKYSITEKHTRVLEAQIRKNPEQYLWTHKRWKHKRKVG